MPKKTKAKTPPAKTPPAKPLRGARLLRSMFGPAGAKFSIEEIVAAMALGGKTPNASASAAMSILGNPQRTKNPLRIVRDKETKKYSVDTSLAGADSSSKKASTAVAGAPGKKKPRKKAARKTGGANGPRLAAA